MRSPNPYDILTFKAEV